MPLQETDGPPASMYTCTCSYVAMQYVHRLLKLTLKNLTGMLQEVRQHRLEGDKEMYARRLELQRIEAQQKAEEATRR